MLQHSLRARVVDLALDVSQSRLEVHRLSTDGFVLFAEGACLLTVRRPGSQAILDEFRGSLICHCNFLCQCHAVITEPFVKIADLLQVTECPGTLRKRLAQDRHE